MPDLAVANWGTSPVFDDGSVSILLGYGDGRFHTRVNYPAVFPSSVAIGDLDGDQAPDLAVAHYDTNKVVSVRLGIGDGTFNAAVYYAADDYPISVAIGDLDGDQASDLAVANFSSDNVSVLLNQRVTGIVRFADGTPIQNGVVQAYVVNAGVVAPIGEVRTTNENGRFVRPSAFADPTFHGGLLAAVSYRDPGTGRRESIVNYPNNDPFGPFRPGGPRIEGTEHIIFPNPTILQAGFQDGRDGWEKFDKYLRANAGNPGELPAPLDPSVPYLPKAPLRLPAFMTFVMPSWQQNGVFWGYDNRLPLLGSKQHDDNIVLLDGFIRGRVRGVLAEFVPNKGMRERLPVNLCAHSMGAIISRGWMVNYASSGPPVNRYVSFDGVHGGTAFSWGRGSAVLGFAEWYMNGVNYWVPPPLPPLSPRREGWNYSHALDWDPSTALAKHLLLSASCGVCLTVNPNCSALGIGRTMLRQFPLVPNRHKGRFIGGYEWHTDKPHIPRYMNRLEPNGIATDPVILYHVMRFLQDGVKPPAAYRSGDAYSCEDNPPPDGVDNPGVFSGVLSASSWTTAELAFHIDANPSISMVVFVDQSGAGFDVLDASGVSIVPANAQILPFGDGYVVLFTLGDPPVGQARLQLSAGSAAVMAFATVTFENQRGLVLDLPVDALMPQTPALILGSVHDSAGAVIVGTFGTIDVAVTLPNGRVEILVLYDDGNHGDGPAGDGVFGNWLNDTAVGGRYVVGGNGSIELPGEIIERTTNGLFVVDSSPAFLVAVTDERALDLTGNGKFDQIEIDIEVGIDEVGKYRLASRLLDLGNEGIGSDRLLFEVQTVPASYTATLTFDAAMLVAHGQNGPWQLTQIELWDDEQVLVVGTLPDYMTAAYVLGDFEPPPPPLLVRALPDNGPNGGGNEIVLQGGYFEHVTGATIDGQLPLEFEIISHTAIRLVMPPARTAQGGPVDIEVGTPWHTVVTPDVYTYHQFVRLGDLNCDDVFNGADIDPFFLALGDPAAYAIAFPKCEPLNGDMNRDGRLDGGDIDPFFQCLGGGNCR